MDAIEKLNQEVVKEGVKLEPCEFLHECMESPMPRNDL